ncbi:hypothetical protein [Nonomuraea cavernae]|uniref:hypothetical protein n=1 Tax=Nonomuraea cavernae TaxID=2045107 RepID=UPI0033DC7A59
MVVDSTSYADPATSRNDVTSKLPDFAQGCDWIGFAAVTGSSESSSCRQDAVAIAATRAENPNDNPVIEERVRSHRLTEVLPRAVKLFDCPAEGEGSDVLGRRATWSSRWPPNGSRTGHTRSSCSATS